MSQKFAQVDPKSVLIDSQEFEIQEMVAFTG